MKPACKVTEMTHTLCFTQNLYKRNKIIMFPLKIRPTKTVHVGILFGSGL